MGIDYNRRNYVDNYELSYAEYHLLPEDMRVAYLHHLFKRFIPEYMPEEINGMAKITEFHKKYFNIRGYEVDGYDICSYTLRKVGEDKLNIKPGVMQKVENYAYLIASTRSAIYENKVRAKIVEAKRLLDNGCVVDNINFEDISYILYCDVDDERLTKEDRDEIISSELSIIGNIYKNEKIDVKIDYFLNSIYIEYLWKKGYKVIRSEENGEKFVHVKNK